MLDFVMDYAEQAMSSPWIYLVILGIALLDGFFPIVPSETLVITAGVFAASTGSPEVLPVIAVAAVGAFLGDHVSYAIGRVSGERIARRAKPGTRAGKAFAWAERALAERGGVVLVAARYIPGGRTAATVTVGAVGFPLRRFTPYAALAAASWAVYSVLVGYLGGAAFEHDPFKGLLLGLGMAIGITLLVELIRWLRGRRAAGPDDAEPTTTLSQNADLNEPEYARS
jgi:membrane protein DedA with SNARE-associated domain